VKRYTIQLSDRFDKFLEDLSLREGITKADAIRRSVAFYSYIKKELEKGNRVLKVVDEENNKEVVFVTSVLFPETSNSRPRKSRKNQKK
jgi:hypothetical protein